MHLGHPNKKVKRVENDADGNSQFVVLLGTDKSFKRIAESNSLATDLTFKSSPKVDFRSKLCCYLIFMQ